MINIKYKCLILAIIGSWRWINLIFQIPLFAGGLCFLCGESGHYSRNCPDDPANAGKPSKKGESNEIDRSIHLAKNVHEEIVCSQRLTISLDKFVRWPFVSKIEFVQGWWYWFGSKMEDVLSTYAYVIMGSLWFFRYLLQLWWRRPCIAWMQTYR